LQTRKWTDQSGAEKYTTEVVLQRFRGELVMLDGRAGGGGSSAGDDGGFGSDEGGGSPPSRSSGGGRAPAGDLDDDIPF
jgi:single-strand DNA-binding protein